MRASPRPRPKSSASPVPASDPFDARRTSPPRIPAPPSTGPRGATLRPSQKLGDNKSIGGRRYRTKPLHAPAQCPKGAGPGLTAIRSRRMGRAAEQGAEPRCRQNAAGAGSGRQDPQFRSGIQTARHKTIAFGTPWHRPLSNPPGHPAPRPAPAVPTTHLDTGAPGHRHARYTKRPKGQPRIRA